MSGKERSRRYYETHREVILQRRKERRELTHGTCSYGVCDGSLMADGYCSMHYQRQRKGIPLSSPRLKVSRNGTCGVSGCSHKVYARGWCALHYNYTKKFNQPPESYDALLVRQGNKCALFAVCGDDNVDELQVDHDHETGLPRGLLCRKHNAGLGMLGDTLRGVEAAKSYLVDPPARKVFRYKDD